METPASISAKKNRVQTINSFKALTRHRHPSNQKYSIYAYFLVDRPKDPKEDFDPVGMYIPLGSYGTPEEAEKVAQHLIKTTGHPMICVRQTCTWGELTSKIGKNSKFVGGGGEHESTKSDHARQVEKTLNEMHQAMQEREKERFEHRKQIEQEIIDEKDHQTDPETIDYYIHNWVMAVKNQAAYQVYLKETEKAKQAFEKRVEAIREQYRRQPHYDKIWLDELKERLTRRDELQLYEAVKAAVEEIYPQIIRDESNSGSNSESNSEEPDMKLDEDSSNQSDIEASILEEEGSSPNDVDEDVDDQEIPLDEDNSEPEDRSSDDAEEDIDEAPLDELMVESNVPKDNEVSVSEGNEAPLDEENSEPGEDSSSNTIEDPLDEASPFDDIIKEHCLDADVLSASVVEVEEVEADVVLDEEQGNETLRQEDLDEFLSEADCNEHCIINDCTEHCPLRQNETIIEEMIKVETPLNQETPMVEQSSNNVEQSNNDGGEGSNEPISASRKKNQRKKAARKAKQQRQKEEQGSSV